MNAGKYGVFLFVYIKRHVNKETVSICGLLGASIAVHKQELVCAKKNCFAKNCEDLTPSKDVGLHLPVQEYFFSQHNSSHMTCAQRKANQFFPLISEIICPSRRGAVRVLIMSPEININWQSALFVASLLPAEPS